MIENEEKGDDPRDSADKQQDIPFHHPWPCLKEMFDVVGINNDSWRMCCKLCQLKHHELLAFKNSPLNLKKHIKVNAYFFCCQKLCVSVTSLSLRHGQ